MTLYFGDLHNHTGYSDGRQRPEQAFAQMRERGLDFAAVTDHAEALNIPFVTRRDKPFIATPHAMPPPPGLTEWEDTLRQAQLATRDGFLAMRGFEFSSNVQGHVNVWFSRDYVDALTLGEDDLSPFWAWLAEAAAGPEGLAPVAGLNHPGVQLKVFDEFARAPRVEGRIATLEIFNRGDDYFHQYLRALDRGWYLGAVGVSDHHGTDWGGRQLAVAGVYADVLTAEGLRDALRARRVYATREHGLRLDVCLDGARMGECIVVPANAELRLEIEVESPASGSEIAQVEVHSNEAQLAHVARVSGRRARLTIGLRAPSSGERWYVARVLSQNRHVATASAIWVQVA